MLYLDNITTAKLQGLADDTGAFVDDADVTAMLSDADDNEIVSFLLHSSGHGDYIGELWSDITGQLLVGNQYWLTVTATHTDTDGTHVLYESRQQHTAEWRDYDDQ